MPAWDSRLPQTWLRLHRDEQGVTSVMSLVAVLMFTMLLVMLTNIVRHLDDKVRLQNAADAAAYSGGAMLARGLNAVALANHLQAETLALTAYLRALNIRGDHSGQALLPIMKYVLGTPETSGPPPNDHLLSNYQRDVLRVLPGLAQAATNEISLRHGLPKGRIPAGRGAVRFDPAANFGPRGPQWGVLWKTSGVAAAHPDQADPWMRTLPVMDPNRDGTDMEQVNDAVSRQADAALRRRELATQYLQDWLTSAGGQVDPALVAESVKQLAGLLDVEYPRTNLPFMLRTSVAGGGAENAVLERDFSFVGVVYRLFDREDGSRLFHNPLVATSDALAFAQVRVFLPRPRYRCCPWIIPSSRGPSSNTDPWPGEWDAYNQTWTAQLMPADAQAALTIVQSPPPGGAATLRPLRLENVQPVDFERLNTH